MKIRTNYLLFCIFFFGSTHLPAQVKIADTTYYNKDWKICEKPLASYYRVGILAALGSVWYYTGKFKDYTINNIPVTEGEYSLEGLREGEFKFYYPNGILKMSGRYTKSLMSDNWFWYYPDGKLKAEIYFPYEPQQFQFIKFNEPDGTSSLENSTGNFTWNTTDFESGKGDMIVKGSFSSGKRSGTWNFDVAGAPPGNTLGYTEKYNQNGKLTRRLSNTYGGGFNDTKFTMFSFSPGRLFVTEAMSRDDLFNINGDSTALNNLIYYLIEHKPTEVNLQYKVFDTAFATILKTISRYMNRIYSRESIDINCKLEFKAGSKGYLEDISLTGDGLDSNALKFFPFLLSKFKNLEMPGDKNVGMETNYTIYCYLLDFQRVLPGNMLYGPTKRMMLSFEPREKMEKYINDNRRAIKDELIDRTLNANYQYYRYRKKN